MLLMQQPVSQCTTNGVTIQPEAFLVVVLEFIINSFAATHARLSLPWEEYIRKVSHSFLFFISFLGLVGIYF